MLDLKYDNLTINVYVCICVMYFWMCVYII